VVREPNHVLRQARLAMPSPTGSGPLSRSGLARKLNAVLLAATGKVHRLDGNYVGKLERGVIRWPEPEYRQALRTVFGVARDADLGLYDLRRGRIAQPVTARSSVNRTGPLLASTRPDASADAGEKDAAQRGAPLTVARWTGRETAALREAARLSLRGFADWLGIAVTTVSRWEDRRSVAVPSPAMQAVLDETLRLADAEVSARFAVLTGQASPGPTGGPSPALTEHAMATVTPLRRIAP
jgi:DNA-binding transcriptional regulator YiaG